MAGLGRKRTAVQLAFGWAVLLLCLGWMLLNGGQVKAEPAVVTVESWDALKSAMDTASGETTITVKEDLVATSTITVYKSVIIQAEDKTITRNAGGSEFKDTMFQVGEGGILTLNNLTLDGKKENVRATSPLVQVETGGTLAVESDAVLKDNFNIKEDGSIAKGGAIFNNGGTVTLNACTISGNSAGLKAENPANSFPGSGGGIYNTGTLTVVDSTIIGNTAVGTSEQGSGYGGGIYSNKPTGATKAGDLLIKDSKIGVYTDTDGNDQPAGNTATLGGGGIYVGNNNHDSGNQMAPTVPTGDENTSVFKLAYSKVSHNTVTKAGYVDTFFGYGDCGGGIAVIGNVTADITGSKIDNNTCNAFIPTTGNEGRLVQTYGGGGLHIYAYNETVVQSNSRWPKDGSSTAINFSGSTTYPTTIDNNNAANRPGGGVTIQCGAVNMTGDVSISNNRAVASLGGYQGGGGIFMTDGSLVFEKDGGSAAPTIKGNTVDNYTNNNIKSSAGGGICLDGGGNPEFTMKAGEISGNTAMVKGGGIYSTKKVTINGGTIANNIVCTNVEGTTAYGGGICNESTGDGGVLNLTGGSIVGNEAGKIDSGICYPGYGGGVYNVATMNMTDGTIGEQTKENKATQKGGGVYSSGKFSHSGGAIAHNIAGENSVNGGSPGYGGGVYVAENEYKFSKDAKIYGNSALAYDGKGGDGGGVYLMTESGNDTVPVTMTMTGGSIGSQADGEAANQAFGHGGGVYVGKDTKDTTLGIAGGIIGTTDKGKANNASKDGGGVYVDSGGTFTMNAGDISQNLASGLGGGTYLSSGGNFTMSGGSMVNNNTEQGSEKNKNDLWLAAGDNKISAAISGKVNIGTADSFNWNKFNLAVPKDKSLANDAKIGIGNDTSSGNPNITANDTAIIENLANTNTDNQFTKQFTTLAGTLKVLGNLDAQGAIAPGYTLVLTDATLPDHLNSDTVLDWSNESATEFKFLDSKNEETSYPLSSSIKAVFTQDSKAKELTNEEGYTYDAEEGKISIQGKARDTLQNNPLTSGTGRNMKLFMSVLYDNDKEAKYYVTYDTVFSVRGEVYTFAKDSYQLNDYADSYQMVVKDFPGDVYSLDFASPFAFSLNSGSTNLNATFAMEEAGKKGNLLITIPKETLKNLANGDYEPVLTVKEKDEGNQDVIYATAKTKLKILAAQKPSIITQPQGTSYLIGNGAKALSVEAQSLDNGTLSYQWYQNGVIIAGATKNTYTPATEKVGSNNYTVKVTNTLTVDGETRKATVTSDEAVVNVLNLPEKPVITTQPIGNTYFKGDVAEAMTVAAKTTDSGTLSYQWYDQNGPIDGATAEVYTPLTTNEGSMTYYAVVTNTITGGFTASVESEHVQVKTLAPADQPSIINQPDSDSYLVGETPVDLSVIAIVADGGTLTYEWFADEQSVGTGKNYTPFIDTIGATNYTVVITNTITKEGRVSTTSSTSKIARVSVFDHPDPNKPLNFEKPNYYLHTYTKTYDLAAVGTYIRDMESHALTIDGNVMSSAFYSYQVEGSRMVVTLNEKVLEWAENGNHTIGLEVVNADGTVENTHTSVTVDWEFDFTSHFEVVKDRSIDAEATIETYERNGEHITGVSVGDISLTAGDYEVAIRGDQVSLILKPNGLAKIPNGTYAVTVIFDNCGSATSLLKVMAAYPPEITVNPENAEYYRGAKPEPLVVTAKSVDGGTLSYQWYKNGTAIDGATSREYPPDTETTGSAEYYVVVTNTLNDGKTTSSASAQSTAATITIRETYPPQITTNLPRLQQPGDGMDAIVLMITAEHAVSYQWYKDTQPLTGETGTTLTIKKDSGDGTYQVVVTGTDGTTVQSNSCTVKWSENKGELEVDVETKPGVPNIALDNYQDLIDGVLTEEEKRKLAEDPEVKYIVTLEADILTEDPVALALADKYGLKIGQYLTLTITKQEYYSGALQKSTEVKELFRTIRLTIDIPEALQKMGRTFKIIRVHNGVAEILEDLDNNPATITMETKLFSTYAMAFTDSEPVEPTPTPSPTPTLGKDVKTGDNANLGMMALLMLLALVSIGVTLTRRKGR